ncbi:uncharacterized protein LOC123035014 [Varanus komodoensis]|uniref:uncharacterized protein LOC123035014 n=1 Tax=Varanus komodoensis TaxID=61221 RepID=UPI001CF79F6C|nr:uncharacterized protein LOC123035014 [Varanus komodoensis]
MNLQPAKKTTLVLRDDKTREGLRSSSFHCSVPNLSETKPMKEEIKNHPEKVSRDGTTSPKPFYATESQSMENLVLKRPVKLAPLDIPLEVKEAQLQKIMSLQRDAQLAAFKLASIGSTGSEPHVKRVKNLALAELENFHNAKTTEKFTLENQDSVHISSTKPICEVQIILPAEGKTKPAKKNTFEGSPIRCRKPLMPQNVCGTLQAADVQEDGKITDTFAQENGRQRFKLKQMKDQQVCLGKNKPLRAMGADLVEGKPKTASLRAHKTLSNASKLLDNVARKHRGRGNGSDEIDEDLLVRRQPSPRRMAVGDIILVDDE